jgi:hypothetical protein
MNDRDLIWEAYLKINEVSQIYVDEVKAAVANNELPFNNIFGNKLRLWIPVSGTKTYEDIMEVIKTIPDFDRFDIKTREVVQKREIEAKYGGGSRERRINLGRAISTLKLPEDIKKKYLDWFATYNSTLDDMEKLKDYAIVISRSPIDILRMSDVGSIDSCHSQGGSYFNCAIQEAKSGGPVAFLVKKIDLDRLGDDEFQNEEIFEDKTRGINGIVALSRIRIRRYKDLDSDDGDIAIPEIRIYGDKNLSGFYNSLKDFFVQKQDGIDMESLATSFKEKRLIRKGGSYTDSSDSELFNTLFDSDKFYGNLKHSDEDEEEESVTRTQQFEEELREFHNDYSSRINNFNIGYSVDGDDEYVYYSANASLMIDLDDYGIKLNDDYFEDLDVDTLRTFRDYKEGVKYRDRIPYGYKNDNKFRKIKKFIDRLSSMDTFFEDMMASIYHGHDGNIYLEICFGEDCTGTSNNTDDYRDFLYEIYRIDDDAEKLKKMYIKALKMSGFVENSDTGVEVSEEDFTKAIKNLSFDAEDDISLPEPVLVLNINPNDLKGLSSSVNKYDYNKRLNNMTILNTLNSKFSERVGSFLLNYLNKFYKEKSSGDDKQLKFKDFYESSRSEGIKMLSDYGIDEVSATVYQNVGYYTNEIIDITCRFSFKIEFLNEKTFGVVKFLDDHIDDVINYMKYVVRDSYDIEDNITKWLRKTYGSI